MDKQIDDQDTLIEGRNQVENQDQTSTLTKYIISKVFPFIWILFSGLFISSNSLIYFIAFLLVLIDLWLCRRKYSYELVGLTWNLDIPDLQQSLEDLLTFQIKPDPYVPPTKNSNVFWISLITTTVCYVFLTIICLLRLRVISFFFLLIITFLEVVNLLLYLKCFLTSKKEAEENTKTLMINQVHSEFLDAAPVVDEVVAPNEEKEKTDDKNLIEKTNSNDSIENIKDKVENKSDIVEEEDV